jgi:hypothetical protein
MCDFRYLEQYEKVYFLGEDVTNKDDGEDDYDDIRSRRRTANKFTSGARSLGPPTSAQMQVFQHNSVPMSGKNR